MVQRVELKVNDRGDFSWSALDLRARPDVVLARASVDLNNPRRAGLCGWSGRDLFESGVGRAVVVRTVRREFLWRRLARARAIERRRGLQVDVRKGGGSPDPAHEARHHHRPGTRRAVHVCRVAEDVDRAAKSMTRC